MDRLIQDIDMMTITEDSFSGTKAQKLTRPMISKINKEIWKLLEPTYFKSIPLDEISDILKKHNIILLQEDDTEWSGWLLGGVNKTEQVYFDLGWIDSAYDMHGLKAYQKITNSLLALSYYKMQSGKYEVLARLT